MPGSTATPVLLTDPGFLYYAPIGSTLPANTVSGSTFQDSWPVAWLSVGATEDGTDFTYSSKVEAISVAEFIDPVAYRTTERSGSLAFAMASWTLSNWSKALNGAAVTVVSGTGATQLNNIHPVQAGNELRAMLGWESLDHTARLVAYQTVNGSEIKSSFKKGTANATIPAEFQFELPSNGIPWDLWTAGTTRA